MSMSSKLWRKYKDYLIYSDEEEIGLRDDAPAEAKEAYETSRMMSGRWTDRERVIIRKYFSLIQPYIITTSRNIKSDAPPKVKDAYEKLKQMHVLLSKSGAIVRV